MKESNVSRVYFTQGADISKPDVVIPIAEGYGGSRMKKFGIHPKQHV